MRVLGYVSHTTRSVLRVFRVKGFRVYGFGVFRVEINPKTLKKFLST